MAVRANRCRRAKVFLRATDDGSWSDTSGFLTALSSRQLACQSKAQSSGFSTGENTSSIVPFLFFTAAVSRPEDTNKKIETQKMKIGNKILIGTLGAVCASVVVGLVVQRAVIRNQGIALTRGTMRVAILQAENTRETISALNRRGAFDQKALIEAYKKTGDLRSSTLYQTVPVVAAWTAIEETAKRENFEFRVTKNLARNPKNLPNAEEKEILNLLEDGHTEEYFKVDEAKNSIVFARPIVLSVDCMACHGDPQSSPTGDGKDILGYPMENWHVGEVHGAFILRSKLDRVDAVVRAGMEKTLVWLVPITCAIGGAFYFFIRSKINRPLKTAIDFLGSASEQTSSAVSEFSRTSLALANGASQQAAALEETSASLEEIASLTKSNASNTSSAKEFSSQTRLAAEAGSTDMNAMTAAMEEIKTSSHNIRKIIKTIDEIAFQTNLLALNAAVEAARAGEAGQGFAAVADEVRNLAQRSTNAARETAEQIQDSISKTERGVQISAKVATGLHEIAAKARQMDAVVEQIAIASQEQSQGIEQVNSAVLQMDAITQSNAASSEQSASSAEELEAQARSLHDAVMSLVEMVGGVEGLPAGSPAPAASEPENKSGREVLAVKRRDPGLPSRPAPARTPPLPRRGEF
jgi:methyl-accepting chemotaxis protein